MELTSDSFSYYFQETLTISCLFLNVSNIPKDVFQGYKHIEQMIVVILSEYEKYPNSFDNLFISLHKRQMQFLKIWYVMLLKVRDEIVQMMKGMLCATGKHFREAFRTGVRPLRALGGIIVMIVIIIFIVAVLSRSSEAKGNTHCCKELSSQRQFSVQMGETISCEVKNCVLEIFVRYLRPKQWKYFAQAATAFSF